MKKVRVAALCLGIKILLKYHIMISKTTKVKKGHSVII